MKKIFALKNFLKILLFLAGLLLTAWIFMPWRQVGEAALLSASRRLPASASITYSTVRSARNGFTVNNLEIRNLMGADGMMGRVDMYFNTLTITPNITASILGMAPSSLVSFTGASIGDVAVTPLRTLPGVAPGSGRVAVSVNRQGIFLDSLRSDGELSAIGSILLDPSEMRILWADMAMDVRSEAFEENLSIAASIFGLPLNQEGPGRWTLRRTMGQ